MRLSLAFAALVAVVPAFANAIPPRVGMAIPISKRAVQIKDDKGVANSQALKSSTASLRRKLGRGSKAYKANSGKAHSPATRASGEVFRRDDGSGGDPLISDQNILWYGPITVGNPPVNFTVNFDTDRSDVFLPGTSCGTTCQGHKIYDTTASSTAKDLDQSFEIFFDDGPPIQGEIFTDTVTIAGLTVTNQFIGVASQYATDLSSDVFSADGVVGLGSSEFTEVGTSTFFDNLVAQGGTTVPQFSFKLAANDAELFLGGSNPSLFTGEFTTLNVTEHGLWQVTLDNVNVGSNQAAGVAQAVIDTGTSIILAPEWDLVKFYQAIPGSKNATDTVGQGFFTFPCSTDPQISLTFGGKQFPLPMSSFSLGPVTQGSTDCIGGIASSDGAQLWTIGVNFLANVYTRFDSGANQVGFADLA